MGNETSNTRYAANDGHSLNSNKRNPSNANRPNAAETSDWNLGSMLASGVAAGAVAAAVYAGSKLLSTENVPESETKDIQEAPAGRCFGWYKCSNCKTTWNSAYSLRGYGQQCRNCFYKGYNYPYKQEPLESRLGARDLQKVHRQDLCEKCKELGYPCYY
ncbi:uncharacterized protein LOC136031907 [Artemia franciscana]|uniref:3CxxC-type domain-containing protein n=1 Tax=Artemia franciscana TaxID=6661 RepID=A0AA88ITF3_ARTSF|nr:hypothetical protein QYM36_000783 [Artemia franciscana]